MIAVLTRSLPFMSRPHAWLELQAWGALAVPTGLLAGGVVGVLINTTFVSGISDWNLAIATALVTGAGPLANVFSAVWSKWSEGREKVAALTLLKALFTACLFVIPLVPINHIGLFILVVAVLGAQIFWAGIVTIRAVVWRANYSRTARTTFAAQTQIIVSIVMSLVGVAAGLALDLNVNNFRWVFFGSAVFSLLGVFSFKRVRVRRQKQLLATEKKAMGNRIFRLGNVFQVLRDDAIYRKYLLWQFIFGSGNLMTIAPLILVLTYNMGVPRLTQILITASVPTLLMPATTPFWASALATRHVVAFRALNSRVFVLASATVFFGGIFQSLWLLWISAVLIGVAFGGGMLIWNLGHNDFAPQERNVEYMSVHVTLTGIRGLIAPLIGVGFYGLLESYKPGTGPWALSLPFVLTLCGSCGFHWLYHTIK